METGAVLAVTLQDANAGDTTTIQQTLIAVAEQMEKLTENQRDGRTDCRKLVVGIGHGQGIPQQRNDGRSQGIRNSQLYLRTETRADETGSARQAERDAVYANRRRIRGERGKSLLRRRGLMLERPFAHCYETGTNEASSSSRPREYSEATPHSHRGIQSESGAAPDDRQRHSARSPGPRSRLLSYFNCPAKADLARVGVSYVSISGHECSARAVPRA